MFDKETEITFVREMSRKNDCANKLLEGIKHYKFNDSKQAVIEKYITFCKNKYID